MWTCKECHHGFQAPLLLGSDQDYDGVCPACLSLDIKYVATELDPNVFFSGVK